MQCRHQAAETPEELPDLVRATDGYVSVGDELTVLAQQVLSRTTVRTSALIGATWDEIDLDDATWIVPAERIKTKTAHVVPLPIQAVAVLRELQAVSGGSRYVIPGRNPSEPISNSTMLFAR
jgi:integrase